MNDTEKNTIEDLAWEIAEERWSHREPTLRWKLGEVGVPVNNATFAHLVHRIRVERAKLGWFAPTVEAE